MIELPPWVQQNLERERYVDEQIGRAQALQVALTALDERLSLCLPSERAGRLPVGMRPDRWHVRVRGIPPAPDSYIPITTPDGGYREPDFGVLEELRSRDMWRSGNGADAMVAEAQRETERAERKAQEKRAALKEDAYYFAKGELEPGVLVGDGKWTAKARGKRGRKR